MILLNTMTTWSFEWRTFRHLLELNLYDKYFHGGLNRIGHKYNHFRWDGRQTSSSLWEESSTHKDAPQFLWRPADLFHLYINTGVVFTFNLVDHTSLVLNDPVFIAPSMRHEVKWLQGANLKPKGGSTAHLTGRSTQVRNFVYFLIEVRLTRKGGGEI